MSVSLPKQILPESEKTDKWGVSTIDHYIEASSLQYSINEEVISINKGIDGYIDKATYNYVLNPYNSNSSQYRNLPAKMRSLNIVEPVINAMVGEHTSIYGRSTVISTNEDSQNKLKVHLNEVTKNYLKQEAINTLNELGIDTKVATKDMPPLGEVLNREESTWDDERAIIGQNALDYITYDKKTINKFQKNRELYYRVGMCFSYKTAYKNDVLFESVPPEQCWWSGDDDIELIEDANVFVRRRDISFNRIIDLFRDTLNDEDIKTIEERYRRFGINNNHANAYTDDTLTNGINSGREYSFDEFESLYHVVWKGVKYVYILKHRNGFNGISETVVNADYQLNEEAGDIEIYKDKVNVVYEGYRIGDDIYPKYKGDDGKILPFREHVCQRQQINNTSVCKLPYNGIVTKSYNGDIKSIGKTGLAYQALYNIYSYRLEATMAANKSALMLMPRGLRPKGWSMDKWLYYVDATKIAWYDETHPKLANILQGIKEINLNLGNYIQQMVEYLNYIKAEWWDTVGFNRQRLGDAKASDGKAVTQEALYRSSMITAEMNRKFSDYIESEEIGLLDVSKLAWINGKKATFINGDRRRIFLEINGSDHLESEYGVFVKRTDEELKKVELMNSVLQAYAQNGMPKGIMAEIIDNGNNFNRIKELAYKADKIEHEYQMQLAQEGNKGAEIQAQSEQLRVDKELQNNIDVQLLRNKGIVDKAYIDSQAKLVDSALKGSGDIDDGDADGDGLTNEFEKDLNVRDMNLKERKHDDEMKFKYKKHKDDTRLKEKQINKSNQNKSNT